MPDELKPKHGYRRWTTRHGSAATRKGKTERKQAQRAARTVVRGKFRKEHPDAPSSREQTMKRPDRTPPPAPPPPPVEKKEA
jgi:hypothetical protein